MTILTWIFFNMTGLMRIYFNINLTIIIVINHLLRHLWREKFKIKSFHSYNQRWRLWLYKNYLWKQNFSNPTLSKNAHFFTSETLDFKFAKKSLTVTKKKRHVVETLLISTCTVGPRHIPGVSLVSILSEPLINAMSKRSYSKLLMFYMPHISRFSPHKQTASMVSS